jgi:hypothetical protein
VVVAVVVVDNVVDGIGAVTVVVVFAVCSRLVGFVQCKAKGLNEEGHHC